MLTVKVRFVISRIFEQNWLCAVRDLCAYYGHNIKESLVQSGIYMQKLISNVL